MILLNFMLYVSLLSMEVGCVRRRPPSSEFSKFCTEPLGMRNGAIRDDNIKHSPAQTFDDKCQGLGRAYEPPTERICLESEGEAFYQINFDEVTVLNGWIVSGVDTLNFSYAQGEETNFQQYTIKEDTLSQFTEPTTWLEKPLYVNYVRFTFVTSVEISIELFGCPHWSYAEAIGFNKNPLTEDRVQIHPSPTDGVQEAYPNSAHGVWQPPADGDQLEPITDKYWYQVTLEEPHHLVYVMLMQSSPNAYWIMYGLYNDSNLLTYNARDGSPYLIEPPTHLEAFENSTHVFWYGIVGTVFRLVPRCNSQCAQIMFELYGMRSSKGHHSWRFTTKADIQDNRGFSDFLPTEKLVTNSLGATYVRSGPHHMMRTRSTKDNDCITNPDTCDGFTVSYWYMTHYGNTGITAYSAKIGLEHMTQLFSGGKCTLLSDNTTFFAGTNSLGVFVQNLYMQPGGDALPYLTISNKIRFNNNDMAYIVRAYLNTDETFVTKCAWSDTQLQPILTKSVNYIGYNQIFDLTRFLDSIVSSRGFVYGDSISLVFEVAPSNTLTLSLEMVSGGTLHIRDRPGMDIYTSDVTTYLPDIAFIKNDDSKCPDQPATNLRFENDGFLFTGCADPSFKITIDFGRNRKITMIKIANRDSGSDVLLKFELEYNSSGGEGLKPVDTEHIAWLSARKPVYVALKLPIITSQIYLTPTSHAVNSNSPSLFIDFVEYSVIPESPKWIQIPSFCINAQASTPIVFTADLAFNFVKFTYKSGWLRCRSDLPKSRFSCGNGALVMTLASSHSFSSIGSHVEGSDPEGDEFLMQLDYPLHVYKGEQINVNVEGVASWLDDNDGTTCVDAHVWGTNQQTGFYLVYKDSCATQCLCAQIFGDDKLYLSTDCSRAFYISVEKELIDMRTGTCVKCKGSDCQVKYNGDCHHFLMTDDGYLTIEEDGKYVGLNTFPPDLSINTLMVAVSDRQTPFSFLTILPEQYHLYTNYYENRLFASNFTVDSFDEALLECQNRSSHLLSIADASRKNSLHSFLTSKGVTGVFLIGLQHANNMYTWNDTTPFSKDIPVDNNLDSGCFVLDVQNNFIKRVPDCPKKPFICINIMDEYKVKYVGPVLSSGLTTSRHGKYGRGFTTTMDSYQYVEIALQTDYTYFTARLSQVTRNYWHLVQVSYDRRANLLTLTVDDKVITSKPVFDITRGLWTFPRFFEGASNFLSFGCTYASSFTTKAAVYVQELTTHPYPTHTDTLMQWYTKGGMIDFTESYPYWLKEEIAGLITNTARRFQGPDYDKSRALYLYKNLTEKNGIDVITTELEISKEQVIGTIEFLPAVHNISFEFYLGSFKFDNQWKEIIHFSIGENANVPGSRIPGAWLNPMDTRMSIISEVNGNNNFPLHTPELDLNRWYHINIALTRDHYYLIELDGVTLFKVENTVQRVYENVTVYASSPWYDAVSGTIRNLQVKKGVTEVYIPPQPSAAAEEHLRTTFSKNVASVSLVNGACEQLNRVAFKSSTQQQTLSVVRFRLYIPHSAIVTNATLTFHTGEAAESLAQPLTLNIMTVSMFERGDDSSLCMVAPNHLSSTAFQRYEIDSWAQTFDMKEILQSQLNVYWRSGEALNLVFMVEDYPEDVELSFQEAGIEVFYTDRYEDNFMHVLPSDEFRLLAIFCKHNWMSMWVWIKPPATLIVVQYVDQNDFYNPVLAVVGSRETEMWIKHSTALKPVAGNGRRHKIMLKVTGEGGGYVAIDEIYVGNMYQVTPHQNPHLPSKGVTSSWRKVLQQLNQPIPLLIYSLADTATDSGTYGLHLAGGFKSGHLDTPYFYPVLSASGVNLNANVARVAADLSDQFSISFMFQANTLVRTLFILIDANSKLEMRFVDKELVLRWQLGVITEERLVPATIVKKQWHSVALTYNKKETIVYIDSVVKDVFETEMIFPTFLRLLNDEVDQINNNRFPGRISCFQVYNSPLTASEVYATKFCPVFQDLRYHLYNCVNGRSIAMEPCYCGQNFLFTNSTCGNVFKEKLYPKAIVYFPFDYTEAKTDETNIFTLNRWNDTLLELRASPINHAMCLLSKQHVVSNIDHTCLEDFTDCEEGYTIGFWIYPDNLSAVFRFDPITLQLSQLNDDVTGEILSEDTLCGEILGFPVQAWVHLQIVVHPTDGMTVYMDGIERLSKAPCTPVAESMILSLEGPVCLDEFFVDRLNNQNASQFYFSVLTELSNSPNEYSSKSQPVIMLEITVTGLPTEEVDQHKTNLHSTVITGLQAISNAMLEETFVEVLNQTNSSFVTGVITNVGVSGEDVTMKVKASFTYIPFILSQFLYEIKDTTFSFLGRSYKIKYIDSGSIGVASKAPTLVLTTDETFQQPVNISIDINGDIEDERAHKNFHLVLQQKAYFCDLPKPNTTIVDVNYASKVTLDDVPPGYRYDAIVVSQTHFGSSPPAVETFNGQESAPRVAPVNVTCFNISGTSLNVSVLDYDVCTWPSQQLYFGVFFSQNKSETPQQYILPSFPMTRDTMIATIDLPTVYHVLFDLYIEKLSPGYANILRLTSNDDDFGPGSRLPTLWFNGHHPSLGAFLHICSHVNDDYNHCFNFVEFEMRKWYRYRVGYNSQNSYFVEVNGEIVHETQVHSPTGYENVRVYASDKFYESAAGYVTLRNLVIHRENSEPLHFMTQYSGAAYQNEIEVFEHVEEHLEPFTEYFVHVVAANDQGHSPPAVLSCWTDQWFPERAPYLPSANFTDGMLRVEVTDIGSEYYNSFELLGYNYTVLSVALDDTHGLANGSFEISYNTEAFAVYTIIVEAVNEVGAGPSYVGYIISPQLVPNAGPEIVEPVLTTNETVTLHVKALNLADERGIVTYYQTTIVSLDWQEEGVVTNHSLEHSVENTAFWSTYIGNIVNGSLNDPPFLMSSSQDLLINISSLLPFTNYLLNVSACTEARCSLHTTSSVFQTNASKPTCLSNLTIDRLPDFSLVVHCRPTFDCIRGPQQGCCLALMDTFNDAALISSVDHNQPETEKVEGLLVNHTFGPDLEVYYNYTVVAYLCNDLGGGPIQVQSVLTRDAVPDLPPELVELTSVSSSEQLLTLTPPAVERGTLVRYFVMFSDEYGVNTQNVTVEIADDNTVDQATEVHFEDLVYFAWHSVKAAAGTDGGFGPFSELVQARTLEDVPLDSPDCFVRNMSAFEANLTCIEPSPINRSGSITHYKFFTYATLKNLTRHAFEGFVNETFTFGELFPDTLYTTSFAACTSVGCGPVYNLTFHTNESVPLSFVTNVTQIDVERKASLSLQWLPVDIMSIQGEIDHVFFTLNDQNYTQVPGFSNATIEPLDNYTRYEVNVTLYTKVGPGPPSQTVIMYTPENVPSSPPLEVTRQNTSSSSLEITWQPIPEEDEEGVIIGFQVYLNYTENNEEFIGDPDIILHHELFFPGEWDLRGCNILGLVLHGNYSVRVAGVTSTGVGELSDPVYVLTDTYVNGNWTVWMEWGQYSTSCGGDCVQNRYRTCSNPEPKRGGADCEGEGVDVRQCPNSPICEDLMYLARSLQSCSEACSKNGDFFNCYPFHKQPDIDKIRNVNDITTNATANLTCELNTLKEFNPRFFIDSNTCSGFENLTHAYCDVTPSDVNERRFCRCRDSRTVMFNPWSEWSVCSKQCGFKQRKRMRDCSVKGTCLEDHQVQAGDCKIIPCPVDGNWGSWTGFDTCTKTCNGGLIRRYRWCINPPPKHGGTWCKGLAVDAQSCGFEICPVDGEWGAWSPAEKCTQPCGLGGRKYKRRKCDAPPPGYSGKACEGEGVKWRPCNEWRACTEDIQIDFFTKLMNETWIYFMWYPTSPYAMSITQKLNHNIGLVLDDTFVRNGSFVDLIIHRYTKGSVNANFSIVFKRNSFVESLTLQHAIETGFIDTMPVQSISVTSDDVNDEPPDFSVTIASSTSAMVQWVDQYIDDFYLYYVFYRPKDSDEWIPKGTRKTWLLLEDLAPFTVYSVRLVIASRTANGIASKEKLFETPSSAPFTAPRNFNYQYTDATTVYTMWDAIPPEDVPGTLTAYQLRYRSYFGDKWTTFEQSPTYLQHMVHDVRAGNYLVFEVRGKGGGSLGPPATLVARPENKAPEIAPRNVHLNDSWWVDQFKLSWNAIPKAKRNGKILGYSITYTLMRHLDRDIKIERDSRTVIVDQFTQSAIVKDLLPYAEYSVQLSAFTAGGSSPVHNLVAKTCKCPHLIYTSYYKNEPYVKIDVDTPDIAHGFLPELIKNSLEEVCTECLSYDKVIVYFNKTRDGNPSLAYDEDDLKKRVGTENHVCFPILAKRVFHEGYYPFIKIVPDQGSALVVIKQEVQTTGLTAIIGSAISAWPALLVSLLLAAVFGGVLWFSEQSNLDSDLDVLNWLRGFFDGFWLAFITMTTVGYGDLTPSTVVAKGLTVIWMLIGLVVVGILMGSLTTFLSASAEVADLTLYNTPTATLRGTSEYMLAVQKNAKLDPSSNYTTYKDVLKAVQSKEVEIGLLSAKFVMTIEAELDSMGLRAHEIVDLNTGYGMILSGGLQHMQRDLMSFVQTWQKEIIEFYETEVNLLRPQPLNIQHELLSMEEIQSITLSLLEVFLVLSLIGILWWKFREYRAKARIKPSSKSAEMRSECQTLVEEFVENFAHETQKVYEKMEQERVDHWWLRRNFWKFMENSKYTDISLHQEFSPTFEESGTSLQNLASNFEKS